MKPTDPPAPEEKPRAEPATEKKEPPLDPEELDRVSGGKAGDIVGEDFVIKGNC